MLNSPKKGNQCDYFKPETQKIYDTACAPVSLSELFEREVIYERAETETKVIIPEKPQNKSRMTQLNIRVHRNVAESFRKFCKQSHLSQNNALALLLAPENQDRLELVNAPWEELQYQKEINKQLEIQNEQLHKMEIETRRRERNYRKIIAAISNETINAIGRSGCKGFAERPVLCPMRFKDAKRQFDFEDYRYPDKSGIERITLVGIVQGIRKMIPNKDVLLPAALFVLGENNAGDKVKFRWYPREDNVGVSPRNKSYAYSGAKWLTGFVVAPDGAVDLIAAIPVELLEEDRDSKEQSFTNIDREQIDSLEEKIRDAKERTQGKAPHE